MLGPSTRERRHSCEEEPVLLTAMEVGELSLKGDIHTSAEEMVSLAMMELGRSSLEGDREALGEELTSPSVTEIQELSLSLSSGVSQLSLCEKEGKA